jgi:hypothetical protein
MFNGYRMKEFLEYDYIGAPWIKDERHNSYNVGNGGFSLRNPKIMIEITKRITNKEDYEIPEDVYFTKKMLEYSLGKLASWEVARGFATELISHNMDEELPVGGHKWWWGMNFTDSKQLLIKSLRCLVDEKLMFNKYNSVLFNYTNDDINKLLHKIKNDNNLEWININYYNDYKYILNTNSIDLLLNNNIFIGCLYCLKLNISIKEYNYYFKLYEYLISVSTHIKQITNYNAINHIIKYDGHYIFRYFCFRNIDYLKYYNLPKLKINLDNEMVFIEFRVLPHIEFILINNIIKLGNNWSYTIVCGNLNYDFFYNIRNKYSLNINIIKLNYGNIDINIYNQILTSTKFWKLFNGTKILLCQEDSIIFNYNYKDFLNYDYIGAPWEQTGIENKYNIGNGGFSLRNRELMIEICSNYDVLKYKNINQSFIQKFNNYNKDKLIYLPEDVLFCKIIIDNYIEKNKSNINVNFPDYKKALAFSSEIIPNNNSYGGHKFWLSDIKYKDYNYLYYRIFNICGFYSPYEYSIGGGEKYLTYIIKSYIEKYKNTLLLLYFFTNTNTTLYKNTLEFYFNNHRTQYLINKISSNVLYDYKGLINKFFSMGNEKIPIYKSLCSKENSIYHCQFPFDLNKKINENNLNYYKSIIVNSEYTKKYYELYTNQYLDKQKIIINYPPCIEYSNNQNISVKDDKLFVMIGRIFKFNKGQNNKYYDEAIKVFNKLNKHNIDYKLVIIGSVKSKEWYNYLISLIGNNNNITIIPDASEIDKNKYLKKASYFIHLAGLNCDVNTEPQVFEHFGISIIEGIKYGCIPICVNGGNPSFIIKNKVNGFLINNSIELYDLIKCIKQYKIQNSIDIIPFIESEFIKRYIKLV